jgi:hypothetical protein
MSDVENDEIDMTAETVARDLIGMLVGEIRLMPDIWQKLGPNEQDDIIERVRKRVMDNVRKAVTLIASAGRITVAGDLKKVTFADKVEAVFTLAKSDPSALELCHAQGQACLIVVSNPGAHMDGAGDEAAQRQLSIPGVDDEANAVIKQVQRRTGKPSIPPSDDEGGDHDDE